MRKDCLIINKISLLIKANHLASSSESRVYRKSSLLSYRWSQKQLTKILAKDSNRLYISFFLSLFQNLIRDRRLNQTLKSIIKCHMHLLCQWSCRITSLLTEIIIYLLTTLLWIRINLKSNIALLLCSQCSQKSMRSYPINRIRELKVVSIFCSLWLACLLSFLCYNSSCLEDLSYSFANRCSLTKTLSNNISRSSKSLIHRGNLIVEILLSLLSRIHHLNIKHSVSKWLKSCLFRNCSTCTTLRLIWKINILQLPSLHTVLNLFLELLCKRSCCSDVFYNSDFSLLHFREHISPMANLCDCHFIQATCALFTIPTDKRNCCPILKEVDTVLHLPILNLQALGNTFDINLIHSELIV